MDANAFRDVLIWVLSGCDEVLGVAQTGDMNAPLIPGHSDIDLFVLCRRVLAKAERLALYAPLDGCHDGVTMEVCAGGVWGYGDIFMAGGIDVMPMYFPVEEMTGYVDEVLAGKHLAKEGRFYPIGRLASIESIHVLYEKERSWSCIIEKVKAHPKALFEGWYAAESSQMLDEEDLGRASLRHEVLFYHQVTEAFADHFLQALYAKNDCYFPSRKRTEVAIASFAKKPADCCERLTRMLRLGTAPDTIEDSIAEMRALAAELLAL